MKSPLVSVVVPTFNRAALLPRALDSVVVQTLTDWEIVLVDDGSTDDTDAVAGSFARRLGDRFVVIRQPNSGSSAARNRGIDVARGQLIAFLDSDDEYLPRKLERQVLLFERCPDLGLVYCDSEYVDLDGVVHASVLTDKAPMASEVPLIEIAPGLFRCGTSFFDVLLRGYFVSTISGMVRRSAVARDIRFPVDACYAEEWLFYLKVARQHAAGFVNERHCRHHFVAGSLARTSRAANSLNSINLFRAFLRDMPDLNRDQRRVVRGHLAAACRQAGCDAFRSGDHRAARRHFGTALVHEPTWSTARDLAHSWARRRRSAAQSAAVPAARS